MLRIQFKDGSGAPVDLIPPGKTIGKGVANDVVIDRPNVQGFHADLKVEKDIVTITDVNSESGTYVNGDRIEGAINLRAGDTVTVGGVELEIVEDDGGAEKTLVLSGTALLDLSSDCWSLVAASGLEKGQIIPIIERVQIGRALDCDISILEPALSRKHAELYLEGEKLMILDLGSVNGTWVNSEKVSEAELKEGDRLQFDKVKFVVREPTRT